jgi:flagellar motor switch protein FliN/FliY
MSHEEPSEEIVRIREASSRFGRVPFLISVELGRGKLKIRELLALAHGSIVALNRQAGSSFDIRVNETLLGKGEPVIHENSLGIKINEIAESEI